MSRNHQRSTHKAKSRSPLTLIGAGFLATAPAAATVNLASAGEPARPGGKADHAPRSAV
ncbi:hypothetical protein P1P75_20795 [Streptomyces sp. ID05-39B]|uniref:hypothetical protein n=1 Tax=Streptomyces sp. ID05-39B TaxID=3028664 RepID=UPI0029A6CD85|nr:hypothetical protein [Streptomyces sp. ID05-39B]MDX3528792.1 hypothetical protein [Streptomyces sp. ID05-39B]MDX3528813.1 hypothetical protein [Streptomyces sp. ID05-39B]